MGNWLKLGGNEFTIKEKKSLAALPVFNYAINVFKKKKNQAVYLCSLYSTLVLRAQLSTFCWREGGIFCHSFSLFGKRFKPWICQPIQGSWGFLRLSRYATALQLPPPSAAAFLFPTWTDRKWRWQNYLVFSPSSMILLWHGYGCSITEEDLFNLCWHIVVWFSGQNLGLL